MHNSTHPNIFSWYLSWQCTPDMISSFRIFVPTMYICFVFFICLFLFLYIWKGMTSCWQIYFRESKAIYYPHGYLPLSRPGLIKTNLHSHIKAGTRPTLKNYQITSQKSTELSCLGTWNHETNLLGLFCSQSRGIQSCEKASLDLKAVVKTKGHCFGSRGRVVSLWNIFLNQRMHCETLISNWPKIIFFCNQADYELLI